jgi:6-phosphofructo-2-kinase/fructose-2,6-biphosphatase 4
MNIHNRYRTIYFARVSFYFAFVFFILTPSNFIYIQSGQSLIEHSYKADSDLSPAGWDYAEKLKDFVLERRAKSLEQRGLDPSQRKLVVCMV